MFILANRQTTGADVNSMRASDRNQRARARKVTKIMCMPGNICAIIFHFFAFSITRKFDGYNESREL